MVFLGRGKVFRGVIINAAFMDDKFLLHSKLMNSPQVHGYKSGNAQMHIHVQLNLSYRPPNMESCIL